MLRFPPQTFGDLIVVKGIGVWTLEVPWMIKMHIWTEEDGRTEGQTDMEVEIVI